MKNSDPAVKGIYMNRGSYTYQPPMVDGIRPAAIRLRTSDLGEAIAKRQQILDRQFQHKLTEPLDALIDRFLADRLASGDHRGTSHRSFKANLSRFKKHFRCQPSSITPDDLLQWKKSMIAEVRSIEGQPDRPALSSASILSYMTYAQAFMSYLEESGEILTNPFRKLPRKSMPQSVPTRRGKHCSKALRDQLLANCTDPLLRPVLYMGFHLGLRRQEILNIRPDWFEHVDGLPAFLHVQNETGADGTQPFVIKDAEAKRIPINDVLAKFLQQHGTDHSPYFIAPRFKPGKNQYRWEWKRRWSTYMTKQKCPWVTVHTMRHTFVTLLLSAPPAKRPSLLHLERWTGTDVRTLQKSYAHLIDDPDLINAAN